MDPVNQRMTPLHVAAELSSPVALRQGWIMLDSLLAYQIALRSGILTSDLAHMQPIDIPVAKEPGGRFHLCSASFGEVLESELQHTVKRPAVEQFQIRGDARIRRVDIAKAANKGYRIPRPVTHYARLEWWLVGQKEAIEELLSTVTHLGHKRSVGLGRVERWSVEPCDEWDGFPVARDGRPLRPLPKDWPSLVNPQLSYHTLTFPYWDKSREELCAIP